MGRERELCGGEKGQQMASFIVHREELHDLPQQRGTREKRLLGNWAHLRRQ